MKNILFYNGKGGQGKTTLAVTYAKLTNAKFLTNDISNYTSHAFNIETNLIYPDDDLMKVDLSDDINVFDFGGFLDPKLEILMQVVDKIVIPICYQGGADFFPVKKLLEDLEKYKERIIVVINNTIEEHQQDIKLYYQKKGYETVIINKNEFLTIADKSIYQQLEECNGDESLRSSYKNVIDEFEELILKLNKKKVIREIRKERVAFLIKPSEKEKLEKIAEEAGKTVSTYVYELVKAKFNS